jgi:hypothetical protein
MSILEKEGCAAKDLKEANKIKRFNLRHQIEKHYQDKDNIISIKNKEINDNKYSYKRYDVTEDRGYNIVNMEKINKAQKKNKKLKHNVSEWETLCKNSQGVLKENFNKHNESLNNTNISNISNHVNKGKIKYLN